jgi:hypothetical protein
MKIDQNKDGSGTISFTDKEIEILKNKKKLEFSPIFFKHFSNTLMKLCVDFQNNFDEDLNHLITYPDTEIKSKDE